MWGLTKDQSGANGANNTLGARTSNNDSSLAENLKAITKQVKNVKKEFEDELKNQNKKIVQFSLPIPRNGLRFPLNMPTDRPIMQIKCMDSRKSLGLDSPPIIYLPVPESIENSNGSTYSDAELGIFGSVSAPTLNSVGTLSNTNNDLIDGMISSIVGGAIAAKNTNLGSAALLALNKKIKNEGIAAAARVSSRAIINPNIVSEYTATSTRSYSFSYKFIPDNRDESKIIETIVKLMQVSVYPEREGLLLRYPPRWKVNILRSIESGEKLPGILDMYFCYLNSCNVTYNSTINAFFEDGTPIETDISFELIETRGLNANDILELQSTNILDEL